MTSAEAAKKNIKVPAAKAPLKTVGPAKVNLNAKLQQKEKPKVSSPKAMNGKKPIISKPTGIKPVKPLPKVNGVAKAASSTTSVASKKSASSTSEKEEVKSCRSIRSSCSSSDIAEV